MNSGVIRETVGGKPVALRVTGGALDTLAARAQYVLLKSDSGEGKARTVLAPEVPGGPNVVWLEPMSGSMRIWGGTARLRSRRYAGTVKATSDGNATPELLVEVVENSSTQTILRIMLLGDARALTTPISIRMREIDESQPTPSADGSSSANGTSVTAATEDTLINLTAGSYVDWVEPAAGGSDAKFSAVVLAADYPPAYAAKVEVMLAAARTSGAPFAQIKGEPPK
ncbi:MAG: hypothetical protein SFZ23_04385 [Planctomycetota bacterium]|nr:hypothetical protein [Planctomycetota bacterium]